MENSLLQLSFGRQTENPPETEMGSIINIKNNESPRCNNNVFARNIERQDILT